MQQALQFANLLCSGMLAGALFVIHYGIRTPIASLEERAQILTRKAFILQLRVLIPALFIPTILTGATLVILDWPGFGLRTWGVVATIVCFLTALIGTAPINKLALSWSADAPPANWRAEIARWEQLDTFRTWAAVGSFGLLVAALTTR